MIDSANVLAAAERIVAAFVAPGHALAASDADRLAVAAPPSPAAMPAGARAVTHTAMILARLHTGRREAALELAEAVAERADADDPGVAALQRSGLYAAISEAYATAGLARPGFSSARRAVAAAEAAGDDAARFRAASLACVCAVLNGDYAAAGREAETARAVAEERAWIPSFAAYPLLLGEALLASAELRPDRLAEIAACLRLRPSDARWSSTADAVEAMVALVDGDPGAAIALATRVTGGAEDIAVLPMIRGFALGILADALLVRGEPERVLTVLHGVPSPPGHALCFDMQRASAHLACDDPLSALRATSGCVSLGAGHALRTLAPVLLRRALAHRRLGDTAVAESEFEDAFRMIADSGSALPLLTLPGKDLAQFLAGLAERRPELVSAIADVRARFERLPVLVARRRPALPAFTRRESELVWGLRLGSSVAELAQGAFLSINTIKTQLRTLYLKLGVRSRTDAVELLERAGYFDRMPPPPDGSRPG
ncbi:helix-turn-helix transcriptional regulator [Microbacterium sp. SORGH_AS_0888]|uniref:helix-turn-helix transcriptional regulator n=1 Tax=Microbacterium sp. SORGH_AS_0888 TaxID=3041791 RepID=UPI00278475AB|nr:helix-turn-helix transcriptional regulator [Microbacterium sp. SORGH_AS_0888]MDQ1129271.1 DNA-binding CsgD family transcriptional regulator [Microbacterium sp. SORGH_AS_0888]